MGSRILGEYDSSRAVTVCLLKCPFGLQNRQQSIKATAISLRVPGFQSAPPFQKATTSSPGRNTSDERRRTYKEAARCRIHRSSLSSLTQMVFLKPCENWNDIVALSPPNGDQSRRITSGMRLPAWRRIPWILVNWILSIQNISLMQTAAGNDRMSILLSSPHRLAMMRSLTSIENPCCIHSQSSNPLNIHGLVN